MSPIELFWTAKNIEIFISNQIGGRWVGDPKENLKVKTQACDLPNLFLLKNFLLFVVSKQSKN